MNKLSLFVTVAIVIFLIFTVSCVSKEVPVTETYYETEYKTEYKMEPYTGIEDVVVDTSEGQTYPSPVTKWQTSLYFKAEGSGTGMTYYYGYEIDTSKHTRNQVKITLSQMAEGHIGVYDLTGVGQISNMPATVAAWRETNPQTGELWMRPEEQAWLDKLNAILTNPERVLVFQPMIAGTGDEISFDTKGVKEFAILANTWNVHAITGVKLVWSDDIFERRTVTKERRVPYQVPVQVEKQRTVTKTKKVPIWEAMLTEETPSTTPAAPLTSPEPPASPTTTPEAEPPVPSSSLLYEDDFSDPNSGWGTGSDDWGKFAYEGGEYSISIERTKWFGYHLNSVSGMQEDFTVEVDARKLSQGTDDAAGIIFRDQRGQGKWSFYVFWVDSNSGTYAIQKYIKDVWAPDLKDFTPSNYINRGANTNRLKVVCKGSQIEVYANEHLLTTVTDTSLTSGYIGLAAETFTSSNAHYHFDNFKLYTND